MCLTPRYENSDKPYNKGCIRYKTAVLIDGQLLAYYQDSKYKPVVWNKAKGPRRNSTYGFHVLLNRDKANCIARPFTYLGDTRHAVVHLKVQMKGFLKSGHFTSSMPTETWQYMRILKVYYPKGYTGKKVRCAKTTQH